MKKSLKEYIDGLDLTAEEKALLAPVLANQKVLGAVDKEIQGVQSEASRLMDEARDSKKKNDDFALELADWKKNADAGYKDMETNFRKANETVAQFKGRLDSLVKTGVLDADDVKDLIAAEAAPVNNPAPKVVERDPDTGKFITKEDFKNEAVHYLTATAKVNDIAAEHYRLFGKPLANSAELMEEAVKSGKKYGEVWAEKYGVQARRDEITAAEKKEHEDRIRKDERQKVMSESQNPLSRPTATIASPVLQRFSPQVDKTVSIPGNNSGVSAAVAAYNEGKYRGGVEQT